MVKPTRLERRIEKVQRNGFEGIKASEDAGIGTFGKVFFGAAVFFGIILALIPTIIWSGFVLVLLYFLYLIFSYF